jgi:hypothetical protein
MVFLAEGLRQKALRERIPALVTRLGLPVEQLSGRS